MFFSAQRGLMLVLAAAGFSDCAFATREVEDDWFAIVRQGGQQRCTTEGDWNDGLT
jgi:hypothetical protein